jgi:HlyD family secretion protein
MSSADQNQIVQSEPEGKPSSLPVEADRPPPKQAAGRVARMPAIIVTIVICAVVGLSLWYLVQPQPLIIQGEADATRIDIAARVDGRVGQRPVERGDNVTAGQLLFRIDNPELVAKLHQAQAGLSLSSAQLANIQAGTRAEVIAQRKAAVDTAVANLTLAQRTYDRVKELAGSGNAPIQRLDENTDSLQVAQRTLDQTKSAYDEAVNGYTAEQRAIARANVVAAQASIDTTQAQVNELVVKAPIAAQVYQIGAELGEYVSPGVPLLSLVDLNDVWLRFDLREDLAKGLKVGDRFQMRVPALGDRLIAAEIKVIASKGEYAGWRATRATGDFDLRTFEIRAYPVTPIPELRPGMSVMQRGRTAADESACPARNASRGRARVALDAARSARAFPSDRRADYRLRRSGWDFQQCGRSQPESRRRRRRSIVDVAGLCPGDCVGARRECRRALRRHDRGDACHPLRRRDRRGLYPRELRA